MSLVLAFLLMPAFGVPLAVVRGLASVIAIVAFTSIPTDFLALGPIRFSVVAVVGFC